MSLRSIHDTREEWLHAGATLLAPRLEEHGNLPNKLSIITSWPYGTKKAIGQAFPTSYTKDETFYICISPVLGEDPGEMLAVLLHELIHALVGCDKNHGKHFKKVALKMGLEGKMKATVPGIKLKEELTGMAMKLGVYPHSEMVTPPAKPKKKARKQIIRFKSLDVEGYSCWLTPAQAKEIGPPICPVSHKLMVLADEDAGDDDNEE